MRNIKKDGIVNSLAGRGKLPIKVVPLYVTDDKSISDAMQTIVSEAGRIDVLVNNAGYGLFGAFEDLSMEEIKNLYETNCLDL
jgi:short-subunit dehydrogenase